MSSFHEWNAIDSTLATRFVEWQHEEGQRSINRVIKQIHPRCCQVDGSSVCFRLLALELRDFFLLKSNGDSPTVCSELRKLTGWTTRNNNPRLDHFQSKQSQKQKNISRSQI